MCVISGVSFNMDFDVNDPLLSDHKRVYCNMDIYKFRIQPLYDTHCTFDDCKYDLFYSYLLNYLYSYGKLTFFNSCSTYMTD